MQRMIRLAAARVAVGVVVVAPLTAQETAFTNAFIVDPAARSVVEGALLVEDGRIRAVQAEVPDDFAGERIDLGGRWVIPGLVDMHTHSFGNGAPGGAPQFLSPVGSARAALYVGVTAILDLFNAEDQIFGIRDGQRGGGIVGAAIFAAGPCLTATNGHCSEYGVPTRVIDSPDDAAREIDELAPKRPDVVKVVYDHASYGGNGMPTIDRATLEAVVAKASEHGFPTIVHVGTWEDVRHAALAGAAAVTHTPAGRLPDDLSALLVESGTVYIPTLAVQGDFLRILEHPEMLDDPLLRAVTSEALLEAYDIDPSGNQRLRGWLAWQRSMVDDNRAAIAALSAAGVPMMTGTDAGNFGVFQGWSVHRELELLTRAGLSNWDALRAATTHPAAFLDQPWGVAEGDEATFVVLDASPVEDVANTRRVYLVVQRGVVVDRGTLITPP